MAWVSQGAAYSKSGTRSSYHTKAWSQISRIIFFEVYAIRYPILTIKIQINMYVYQKCPSLLHLGKIQVPLSQIFCFLSVQEMLCPAMFFGSVRMGGGGARFYLTWHLEFKSGKFQVKSRYHYVKKIVSWGRHTKLCLQSWFFEPIKIGGSI